MVFKYLDDLIKWKPFYKTIVFENYFYLLIIQGCNFIIPLVTFPYLVRVLGTNNYGIVMMAHSLAIFLGIFVDFGFNISATREVSILKKKKKNLSEYFWNIFSIKGLLLFFAFLTLLILCFTIERFFINKIVYLFSFGIVIGQNLFPTWFFQGIEKMRVITFINLTAKLIFTIFIFLFIKEESDYKLVPVFNSFGFIISGTIGFIISLKYINYKKPNFNQIIKIIKESFSLFFSNIVVSLYTSLNTLILGLFTTDSLAGIYASMEKLIIAIKSIYLPLYQAIFPNISIKEKKHIVFIINKLKTPVLISGFIIMTLTFTFSESILHLVFNNELITGYYPVLQILASIALFSSTNMLFVTLFLPAVKEYNKRLKILIIGGSVNLSLVLFLIKPYSIYGVAISASFTELFILILAYISFNNFSKKIIP